jgi:mannosyltransferase OCH1-like enzyme
MRRGVAIFLACTAIFLLLAVHQVWSLLELLFISGIEDVITKEELPPMGSERDDSRKHFIPKIIHQTYINTSIPQVWKEAQASCLALHKKPEWEYKLWTDEMSVDFIASEYPHFLDTFKNYRYPIERADAIRYFVLDHYGGIYLDLDDGCARPMEPLLAYPAFVRKTIPTGISNDVMGAVPHHPFFKLVMDELQRYDRSWILPYITVMASTGPLFLSVIWRHYSDDGFNVGDGPDGGRIRILFPDMYQGSKSSFFTHHLGNSWHGYDVELIFWVSLLTFSLSSKRH